MGILVEVFRMLCRQITLSLPVAKLAAQGAGQEFIAGIMEIGAQVRACWGKIFEVPAAVFKVLRGERKVLQGKEKYQKTDRLFLRWEQVGEKRNRPVYLIVQVCET